MRGQTDTYQRVDRESRYIRFVLPNERCIFSAMVIVPQMTLDSVMRQVFQWVKNVRGIQPGSIAMIWTIAA